jgi:hypothetical protein
LRVTGLDAGSETLLVGSRHRHQLRADHRRDQAVGVLTSHEIDAGAPRQLPHHERLERSSDWFGFFSTVPRPRHVAVLDADPTR